MTVNQSVSYPPPPSRNPYPPPPFHPCSNCTSRVISLGVAILKTCMLKCTWCYMYIIFFSVEKEVHIYMIVHVHYV